MLGLKLWVFWAHLGTHSRAIGAGWISPGRPLTLHLHIPAGVLAQHPLCPYECVRKILDVHILLS